MSVSLPTLPHARELTYRLAHVRMAVDVDEGHLGVLGQAADSVSEPFPRHEDRAPDVEAEGVVLERRAVPVAHQKADQALVRGVHLFLAAGERDAGAVDDREVVGHRVVEPDEAVIEDANRLRPN